MRYGRAGTSFGGVGAPTASGLVKALGLRTGGNLVSFPVNVHLFSQCERDYMGLTLGLATARFSFSEPIE